MSEARSKSPAFQFYPNDWLSSSKIALMSPAEEGAYIRLLCHAWNDPDCSLPDDDKKLAALSRLGEGWFKGSGALVRECFELHPNKAGRLINARLYKERLKQIEWREKCSKGGKKSGETRKTMQESHDFEVNANQTPTKDQLPTQLNAKGTSVLVETKRELNPNSSVFSLQSSDFSLNTKNSSWSETEKPVSDRVEAVEASNGKFRFDDRDMAIATNMYEKCLVVAPSLANAKPRINLDAWANEIRLMRERDKLTPEQIRDMFAFAHADPFWASNILSPAKLREQWPKLEAKRNLQNKAPPRNGNSGFVRNQSQPVRRL